MGDRDTEQWLAS